MPSTVNSSTGDVKNNIEKLKSQLKSIHYSGVFDLDGLIAGRTETYIPLLSYTLAHFSRYLSTFYVERGYEFRHKSDLKFVQTVYKLLLNEFQFRPSISTTMFLSTGYAERKLIMLCQVIHLCKKKHNELCREAKENSPKVMSYETSARLSQIPERYKATDGNEEMRVSRTKSPGKKSTRRSTPNKGEELSDREEVLVPDVSDEDRKNVRVMKATLLENETPSQEMIHEGGSEHSAHDEERTELIECIFEQMRSQFQLFEKKIDGRLLNIEESIHKLRMKVENMESSQSRELNNQTEAKYNEKREEEDDKKSNNTDERLFERRTIRETNSQSSEESPVDRTMPMRYVTAYKPPPQNNDTRAFIQAITERTRQTNNFLGEIRNKYQQAT